MKHRLLLQSTILAVGLIAAPAMAQTTPPATDKSGDQPTTPEIVVTGVFTARAIEKAPISINVVTSKQLEKQQPVSAADLLKNIPGVFVNSGLGEIRNVVFSRGVSANSLDAAGGYYYVSMQEDGLPTDLMTLTNYGPDYFLRSDITLSRLEGLRGGTAVINGPNAPGGIFNYISKTGKSDPGVEVQGKLGLEANGKAPYYRIDAYAGGKLNSQDLYYSIGGFYRASDGPHPAGYKTNRGGQVKANLLWDYGTGSVLVTGKWLDDHNDWAEFTPAVGGKTISAGFDNTYSDLPPANSAHCYTNESGGHSCWDPSNLVHSQSLAFGVTWKQDLSSNVHFENKARYSHNHSHWNNGTVISVTSLTDDGHLNGGTNYLGLFSGIEFLPGTLNFTNHDTGQLLASGTNAGGVLTLTTNNLPNKNLVAEGDGVYSLFAGDTDYLSNQFVDQATLAADLGSHHLALGGYMGLAKLDNVSTSAGFGLMTLTNKPTMIDITYSPVPGGPVLQVTDPGGWAGEGQRLFGSNSYGTQHQYSVFFGDTWKVTPQLTIDAGGRYEAIHYNIFFQSFNGGGSAGGADGNPLTLYDNFISTPGATYRVLRDFSYFNYSGSVNYEFSDNLDSYIRYSSGKKAPDYGGISGISQNGVNTIFPKSQNITQVEVGVKYHNRGLDLQFFPFYSLLTNVDSPQLFTYQSGSQRGQFYSSPPVSGTIETYGVEIAATARLLPSLTGQANLTLQNPKARNFATWVQGPHGDGSDDYKVATPPGDADNNPKILFRGSLNWVPVDKVGVFTQLTYTGKRAANANNAFYLPGFASVDLGGSWQVTPRVKALFNITNLFNQVGVMSWAGTGSLGSVTNRQVVYKPLAPGAAPDGLLHYDPTAQYPIVPSQARAFYLTVSVKL